MAMRTIYTLTLIAAARRQMSPRVLVEVCKVMTGDSEISAERCTSPSEKPSPKINRVAPICTDELHLKGDTANAASL
jgi:hypothetical protein